MNDFTKTSKNWYKNNENLFAQKQESLVSD